MKTTSTRNTPSGQQTTIEIDGEAIARFFGPDSQEMAGRFNNDREEIERLRAENEQLRGLLALCEGTLSILDKTGMQGFSLSAFDGNKDLLNHVRAALAKGCAK